ncbi:MAG: hypothetical protein Q4D19_12005 [Lautropia sp.]|nr:hypothetical protein [Lautropia sp.]
MKKGGGHRELPAPTPNHLKGIPFPFGKDMPEVLSRSKPFQEVHSFRKKGLPGNGLIQE